LVDITGVREIKLNRLPDPAGYVLGLLRRQAAVLETFQTSAQPLVSSVYSQNTESIDAVHRDVNVAWNALRNSLMQAAQTEPDEDRVVRQVTVRVRRGVEVAQRVLDLFDALSDRYGLPRNAPTLFVKIGTILDA
jgi:hypothetical protein